MLETKPASLEITFRQRLINRYLVVLLIDLIVLNLFVEYWDKMTIDSFSITLLTAFVMQILLRFTMLIEHKTGGFIAGKNLKGGKYIRGFVAWAILFGSKFLILYIIDILFGDKVEFDGAIPFIIMLFTMLIFEALVERFVKNAWFKGGKQDKT